MDDIEILSVTPPPRPSYTEVKLTREQLLHVLRAGLKALGKEIPSGCTDIRFSEERDTLLMGPSYPVLTLTVR